MKKLEKKILSKLKNENLDRFAGSSDEEDEEKPMAPPAPLAAVPHNQDDDDDGSDAEKVIGDVDDDGYYHSDDDGSVENDNEENDDDLSSVEGDELDPASKMASAMGRILGTENRGKNESNSRTSSVVLAKTVTPLQKLQHKEKNEQKAMKEKRKANRERNLTALHLPLSIATTNSIESGGKLSVAKELEQERFHRRVATRGVVALFNAITQHQKNHTVDVCNYHEKISRFVRSSLLLLVITRILFLIFADILLLTLYHFPLLTR